jgi:SpoVK/Ycf46/Vps4 family AAA+-type ATPase
MSEKNIYKAVQEAKKEGAVPVFDEADSILGARLNARHSTDMAVNREVNTMLREIEQFEGVVILTTNRHTVLDEALDRRINLKIEMPMPGPTQRAEIWRRHFSSRTPLADDVDFEALGKEFEMAGGNIKNVVMNAVRLAAFRELDRIDMAVLREVAEQETAGIRTCQFKQEDYDQKLKEAAANVLSQKSSEGYI